MKISDMVSSYMANRGLTAKLNKQIKLRNGHIFKKGTVSELLIASGSGNLYHFEAEGEACSISKEYLEFI